MLDNIKNKKVMVLGNSGFKGAWLSLMLEQLNNEVVGVSDKIQWKHGIFNENNIKRLKQFWVDVRDLDKIKQIMYKQKPDIIFHLAAQPIVSKSFRNTHLTFDVNVNGTINVLEAIRFYDEECPIVLITTDKVYKNNNNKEKLFKEEDHLFGDCPYSASKVCCELISSSYSLANPKMRVNIARSGNVIGGGDWSEDRLIPDIFKSIMNNKTLLVRNEKSIRPWIHVLDSCLAYLMIGNNMLSNKKKYNTFNIAPLNEEKITVNEIINMINSLLKTKKLKLLLNKYKEVYPEKKYLRLDPNKINNHLNWKNFYNIEETIKQTSNWYMNVMEKLDPLTITIDQISEYFNLLDVFTPSITKNLNTNKVLKQYAFNL